MRTTKRNALVAGVTALAAVAVVSTVVSTASAATGTTALPAPPLTVTTNILGAQRGATSSLRPTGASSSYGQGAEILSPDGKKVVWFHRAAAGQQIADFRTQTYRGKPVLTFWQGTGLGGLATGTDYIYNDHYRRIATVRAGRGLSADGHEFLITKKGTALILAYTTATADLTSIGGPANQTVINGVVQEVDIKTGKVLFSWNSADHVPYSASEQPLPASASTPWDWFHINAVKVDSHNNLLIDSRNTWAAYDVQRRSGKVLWRLGGKNSSFMVKAAKGTTLTDAGTLFAWQHDIEDHGHGVFTVFDNAAAGHGQHGHHRAGGAALQPIRGDQARRRPPHGDVGQGGRRASPGQRDVAGQHPATSQRQRLHRLGRAPAPVGVHSFRQARLRRQLSDRPDQLPRVPSAVARRQLTPSFH